VDGQKAPLGLKRRQMVKKSSPPLLSYACLEASDSQSVRESDSQSVENSVTYFFKNSVATV